FISSTYLHLIQQPQPVLQPVLNTNNIPPPIQLFNSTTKTQSQIITQSINQSHPLILFLPSTYPTIHTQQNITYTQIHYNFPKSLPKPIYLFHINKPSTQSPQNSKKLHQFNTKLKQNTLITPNINHISELKTKLS
ncbi:DUF4062 domain-containing protein, partial [Staphylococcus aureus]|uniref:DUF4062 domain-containing protein n=1 Tax=Staphylococcus aureus TaxID=1280 RepID=UPI0021B1B821